MYSNVNYKQLYDLAKTSLDELASHTLNSYMNSLNGKDVLPNEIRSKVSNAVGDIHNKKSLKGSLASLQFNLNKLISASDRIEKYQIKEQEIRKFVRNMDDDDEDDRRKLKKLNRELKSIESSIDKILSKKQGSLF